MKYIIVQYGCPNVADELPAYNRPNRLDVLGRTWEQIHAFSDSDRYSLLVDPEPVSTAWQRLLAHTFYNPSVAVSAKWVRVGDQQKQDIIALVEEGLRNDDDIIQQWFSAAEIIKLLQAASTWEELTLAVSCIGGAHEGDDMARRYAEAVLGSRT